MNHLPPSDPNPTRAPSLSSLTTERKYKVFYTHHQLKTGISNGFAVQVALKNESCTQFN